MKCLSYALLILIGATSATFACPDQEQSGEREEFTGEELYTVVSFHVDAGGETDLAECDNVSIAGAEGYVVDSPDYTFSLSEMDPYRLVVSVESDCDSVLLVNSPDDEWFYDDDGSGDTNPRIELQTVSEGFLDVWVGTLEGGYCEATLSLETFD